MEMQMLNALGKKVRVMYQKGEISEKAIEIMYAKNKKEADLFSVFGWTQQELALMEKQTHNLLLKKKILAHLEEMKARSRKSKDQNVENLEKLDNYIENACGIGLRRTIKRLHKAARIHRDLNMEVVATLLDIEFANLAAKRKRANTNIIYSRKDYLLESIPFLLEGTDWKFGFNYASGKNACYIVFVYLPGNIQLTWHTNNFEVTNLYPLIFDEWDGQPCMTLTKLVRYVEDNYIDVICPERGIGLNNAA